MISSKRNMYIHPLTDTARSLCSGFNEHRTTSADNPRSKAARSAGRASQTAPGAPSEAPSTLRQTESGTNTYNGILQLNYFTCFVLLEKMNPDALRRSPRDGERADVDTKLEKRDVENVDPRQSSGGLWIPEEENMCEVLSEGPRYTSPGSCNDWTAASYAEDSAPSRTFKRRSCLPSVCEGLSADQWTCSVCSNVCAGKEALQEHRQVHREVKPHVCPECGARFFHRQLLTSHLRLHTGERPFVCEYCGDCFKYRNLHIAHLKAHTEGKPFLCVMCQARFSSHKLLRSHQFTNHRDLIPQPRGRRRQARSSSEKVQIEAPVEDCSFTAAEPLAVSPVEDDSFAAAKPVSVSQRRSRTFGRRKKCALCPAKFSYHRVFERHMAQHHSGACNTPTEKRRHECSSCGAVFSFRRELVRHHRLFCGGKSTATSSKPVVLAARQEQSSPVKVEIEPPVEDCSFEAAEPLAVSPVEDHSFAAAKPVWVNQSRSRTFGRRRKKGGGDISCALCPLKFSYPRVFQRHMAQHHSGARNPPTEKRRHECSSCGAVFSLRRELVQHHRLFCGGKSTATSSKPVVLAARQEQRVRTYPCEQCPVTFPSRWERAMHLKCHSAQPFSCDQCGAKFHRRAKLKRHQTFEHSDSLANRRLRSQTQEASSADVVHAFPWPTDSYSGCAPRVADTPPHVGMDEEGMPIARSESQDTNTLKMWESNDLIIYTDPVFRGRYGCVFCAATFDLHVFLVSHLRLHTRRPFQCQHCDLSFPENLERIVHILQEH